MSLSRHIIILAISVFLVFGCAQKREQAQKLEKEMSGESKIDSIQEIDSIVVETPVNETVELPEKREITMPPRPKGTGYTVQIAGCDDKSYAMTLVEQYRKRGYEPFITTKDIDSITYYRVRIGMLYSLEDAKLLQQELADKYSVDGWIDFVR